ncbi:MAG: DEAD/DEAH box helicase, partial [Dokdonella sp.]
MSFDTLGLSPALLRALADQGYTVPTAVQIAAIPLIMAGRDLMAGAQTGTGKTAAFTLPLLERLFPNGQRNPLVKRPRALILTPTRELAAQVHESVRGYGKHIGFRTAVIFGGVGMGPQVDSLRRGADIIVATPGRLMDHMQRRTLDLSDVEVLILDEADRMLDMGFLPAIKRILSALPQSRQTLLFSATFSNEIKSLAKEFMDSPEEIQCATANSVASTVTHRVHPVDAEAKRDLLLHLLLNDARQTLVFSRTKHGADKLTKSLEKAGLRAAAIHGNKSQGQRTRALSDFKNGRTSVLVATDIAARGLDIDQLPMVINYEIPSAP